MTSPAAGKRRMDQDVIRLIESNHEVEIMDSLKHFMVKFNGPKNTPYEGGMWKIRVMLPDDYPFKSPSIGFINRIFHPNIDEASGSVCLDVINQTWTPVFDLVNIFESFLPQLLTYPNAADPLNGEAASMLMSRPSEYERRIKDGVKKYATQEAFEKIRDKGMILSYPPNRLHRGGSTSSGSGFNGNSSIGGGGGNTAGGAHALTSMSMPPAVSGFGRGAFNAVAATTTSSTTTQQATSSASAAPQQPTATSSTNDSRSSGVLNNNSNNSSLSNGAAAAANGSSSTTNGASSSSNGRETHNGASSHHRNGAVATNGAASARNSDLIKDVDDMEADDAAAAAAGDTQRRKKRHNNDAGDENEADLLDGDDAGDASDLSEFSENEADQMEL